jgi:hypothetical protein
LHCIEEFFGLAGDERRVEMNDAVHVPSLVDWFGVFTPRNLNNAITC